jgi:protein phosphatase
VAIALRYAARSDVGLVRQNNQDSAYAGPHLLVVADGMGGHAGGDVASSLAIGELAPLDDESHGPDARTPPNAVPAAHASCSAGRRNRLAGWAPRSCAPAHKLALAIGDSRAYLLRDGSLSQITQDHTWVQRLIDEGRITEEEAGAHPQRSLLMRALDGRGQAEPDLSIREVRAGDRYLICSDGLSGVVSFRTLRDTLAAGNDPASTCEAMVSSPCDGAPDNVTCIVADIIGQRHSGTTLRRWLARRPCDQGSPAQLNRSAAERRRPHRPPAAAPEQPQPPRAAAPMRRGRRRTWPSCRRGVAAWR